MIEMAADHDCRIAVPGQNANHILLFQAFHWLFPKAVSAAPGNFKKALEGRFALSVIALIGFQPLLYYLRRNLLIVEVDLAIQKSNVDDTENTQRQKNEADSFGCHRSKF